MNCYIGEIRIFAGPYAPEGWHLCDGTILNVNDYQELFALIGTTYGGDGKTNFSLPNLSSSLPVGTGLLVNPDGNKSNYVLGNTGGNNDGVMLTANNLPSHSHSLNGTTENATSADPKNNVLAASSGDAYENVNIYTKETKTAYKRTLHIDSLSLEGGWQAHPNVQPYLCVNYIISLFGVFPS